jgi:ubiquinone/menaquinone biosynthesis C-methylase UbiE
MTQNEEVKKLVQSQFAKNAEKYVMSESHARGDDLSQLVNWLHPDPNWIILDIATGGGHVAKALSPHVAHVFATDLTQQMLQAAKKHLHEYQNIWYIIADAESLPFLNETFDAVTCRIAAHHFPNPENFIREVNRILRPGGKFVLIDNVSPEDQQLDQFMNTLEKLRDESHVRCHTIPEWKGWLHHWGFEERKSRIRKKTYDFPKWVKRTARNEQQIRQVQGYIQSADRTIHEYFSVTMNHDQIISLQVDEWMALFEKKSSNNDTV